MRKWLLRGALAVVALVVLAFGAAAAFLLTFDPAAYRAEIAEAIESVTGRKVEFAGRIDSSIVRLRPEITLHDVALINPAWASRPHMASAKRVHVVLRLRPLFDRQIAVLRLDIEGLDVLLETSATGERNWTLRAPIRRGAVPADRQAPPGEALPELKADRVILRDARIGYRHGASKLETAATLEHVEAKFAAIDRPIDLAMTAHYEGTRVTTEGTIGALGDLLLPQPGINYPIDLKILFGKSEVDIKLRADLTVRTPAVSGTVTAKTLDLDALRGAAPPAARPGDGRMFSAAPLPLGLLGAFDATGDIRIETLVASRQRMEGVQAKIALKGGDLAAAPFAFTLGGARIQGTLRVDTASEVPAVALKASGNGIRLREVTQLLFDRATLSASLALSVDVTARGRSMRELAAGLNGPVVIVLGPGAIDASALEFLSKDVFSILRADQLALTCGLARFDFARGVGSSRRIVIDTTRATAYGRGWVSLATETLDITFAPTTKGKSLASVAALVPVRVHGALRRPQVSPDLSRTPEELVKAIAGIVEVPGQIFGSLFGDRPGGQRNVGCGTPAGDTRTGPPAPRRGDDKGLLDRSGDLFRRILPGTR